MPSQQQIREEITAKIVQAIERGTLPWRRPWRPSKNSGRPTSLASGKPYSGINPLLLQMHADLHGLRSKWWATYETWQRLGGQVRSRPKDVEPSCWAGKAVLYRPFSKTVLDEDTGEERDERHFMLRYFCLFNADQVDGVEPLQVREPEGQQQVEPDFSPAEELLQKCGADIRHGGDRAFYRRPRPEGSWPNHTSGDHIVLPKKAIFQSMGCYYSTAAHELGHWSEVRTGWDHAKQGYALGELAAEIAACYVTAELGIPNDEPLENHASYVASWLQAMKGDASYIFKASKQASKACDYLLSFVREPKAEPVSVGDEA
jgi:antirestriction protein ArdC